MNIIYFLLPVALLLGFGFLVAFIHLGLSGHYDDLDTPAYRILLDDESHPRELPLTKKRK